jgi:8-oxo-dGTP diphosphatase
MRRRPAAKLIVLDPQARVLLFRFYFDGGTLVGENCWAAPGGGVDPGESFEEAARRELLEETGIAAAISGPPILERKFVLQMPDGERVAAEERYFLLQVENSDIDTSRWNDLERQVIAEHRWWSLEDLSATHETVFPENLVKILRDLGVKPAS